MRASGIIGLASLVGWCLTGSQAAAQDSGIGAPLVGGVQPTAGGLNVNDLRPQLERYFQPSLLPATAPPFVVQSSLGVDLGVTDNAQRVSSPRRADLYTLITPSVSVTQDSARIKSNLVYAPLIQVYAHEGNQNQVDQYFSGQSLVTFVPDALYMDLRGSITQNPRLGTGYNTGSSTTYNRQNSIQTTSFSVTPYAEHRFGGWGTAKIGYSFLRSLQDDYGTGVGGTAVDAFGNPVSNSQGYGTTGNLTSQRERASFTTGENLGRFNDLSVLEAIQYSGSGSYANSHRNQALNELGFALTRRVTALGGVGYQDILYSGGTVAGVRQSSVRINEPTWNFGGRYSPGPNSTLTVLYGRRDGSTSATVDGQFSPTSRTRMFVHYGTGITSDIEDAQNLLETTSVGPAGLVTDTSTGAPIGTGAGGFGLQNGIYRVRRLSVTGLFLANRDSYSATVGQEDRTTLTTTTSSLTGAVVPSGTSTSSIFGSISWQHDLAPDLNTSLSFQYGSTNNISQLLGTNNGRQDSISATAVLNKRFTETLTGNVRYIHTDQTGSQNGVATRYNTGSYSENAFLVGLRKSF